MRRYLLKHTTQTVPVKIRQIANIWDIHTLSHIAAADTLNINDIGRVSISLQQPINATRYTENHATGAFILIDEATHHTVAAGMINALDNIDTFSI